MPLVQTRAALALTHLCRDFISLKPGKLEFPTVSYKDVMSGDKGMFDWLHNIVSLGYRFYLLCLAHRNQVYVWFLLCRGRPGQSRVN
jgi:hypothetical protein